MYIFPIITMSFMCSFVMLQTCHRTLTFNHSCSSQQQKQLSSYITKRGLGHRTRANTHGTCYTYHTTNLDSYSRTNIRIHIQLTNNSTRVVFCKIRTKCKLYHLTSKRIYMHAIWGGLFLVSPTNTFFWFSPVTQNSLFLENHSLQAFGDYCCTATSMMSSFHWFAFHHYISPYIYRSTRRCKLQKNTFSFCSHFLTE